MDRSIAGGSTDYARVAEAIVFLRRHHTQQPGLAMLAAHLELSEFHVQKLFSRWAGISPKRFLQLQIPFARLLSYQQLAALLGRPRAARAVGNAIACNPVAYLNPCHRVLRQSGDVGKYHWGTERKAALIAWEAASDAGEVT